MTSGTAQCCEGCLTEYRQEVPHNMALCQDIQRFLSNIVADNVILTLSSN